MKNKILIGIVVVLVIILVVVRYRFSQELAIFNLELSIYANNQISKFNKAKDIQLGELALKDKRITAAFINQFNVDSSFVIHDTIFHYLYLNKVVSFRCPSIKYINCLTSKCEYDLQNETNLLKIKNISNILVNRYNEDFTYWFDKLKDEKLIKKEDPLRDCSNFFKSYSITIWNEKIWVSFEDFLKDYKKEKNLLLSENNIQKNKFNYLLNSTLYKLNSDIRAYLNDRINKEKSKILESKSVEKSYKSELLGEITYSLEQISFNVANYSSIEESAFMEQYKNNSLATGSMPYYRCYGSYNSCDGWSCSQIIIENGGSDVVVLVKDANEAVVRHAYINEGHRFTFNIQNGSYIVYFYSGQGWNPNKVIPSTNCRLVGGFISNENISKGTYENLQGQQLTYVLKLRENGNFAPRSSSLDEAFK